MIANARALIELAGDPCYEQRCAGPLHMRQNDVWRSAYAILKANLLFLYSRMDDPSAPFFLLIMEDCTIEPADDNVIGREFSFEIRMKTTGRSFLLATDSADSLERWISALTVCSMDYIRLTTLAYRERADDRSAEVARLQDARNLVADGGATSGEEASPGRDSVGRDQSEC